MIETVIFDYKSIGKILINILCDIIIAKKKRKKGLWIYITVSIIIIIYLY